MSYQSEMFIAVVGMSCRFAGAASLKDYWLEVLSARPAIGEPPESSGERFLHETHTSFRHLPTLRAGYLGDLWRGAAPAKGWAAFDPEFALAADLAAAALKDITGTGGGGHRRDRLCAAIGYTPAFEPSSVAWFQHGIAIDQTMDLVRRCFPNGAARDFEALKGALEATLPAYDSRNAQTLFPHTLAAAVADRCDMAGPAYCIDRGEVSSALALQAACDALRAGRADVALAGAVQGLVTPQLMMPYARLGLLSRDGSLLPYGRDASGTLLGEGGGFMALKRHEDAVRDGDRIYAIVKSVAVASEGNAHKPDGGLASALRAVWRAHDADADTIDLIEGNGAGVASIDKAELKALSSASGDSAASCESVALGSAKALVGNCMAASGMAGAIKAALALYHRIIPPGLPEGDLPRLVDLGDTPFYVAARPRPWVHNDAGSARRAGVASVGLGGASSFMVLEQASQ